MGSEEEDEDFDDRPEGKERKKKKKKHISRHIKQSNSWMMKDASCNTYTHSQVCVELRFEIDLVATVAWQSQTSQIAKYANRHPPPTKVS